jgi:DNA-binding transcriptional LysR family regulator
MRILNVLNLETACWIARLGSFTAAAERLYTTQPAVSARVRELESALGIKIFLRQGRGIELTLEGREFIKNVEPLLRQLEELSHSVRNTSAVSGVVRIGAGNICMSWFPSLMVELKQAMPRVTYDVEIDRAGKLLNRLENRKLDLAIVSGPVDLHKFSAMSLGYDRMLWLCAPRVLDDGLSSGMSAFLNTTPLWCVQRESFFWSDAMQVLADHGATLENLNAVSNMAAAKQMIVGGAGIGLISETMARDDLAQGRLALVPGLKPSAPVELSIVCSKDDPQRIVAHIMQAAVGISSFSRAAQ